MADLSPAAQAVLDHFLADCEISPRHGIAAALRAAALYCIREKRILMTIASELDQSSSGTH
jgi:hypothetical protein